MKIANRKARDGRESRLAALEAYANIGDKPEEWKRFRLKYPDFFPESLTEWFYRTAEYLYTILKANSDAVATVRPPLLFYADRLRMVWSRNDPKGENQRFL